MTIEENWLPVVGFEDLYEVSDRGRVRSIPRTFSRRRADKETYVTIPGKVLALSRTKDGRISVQLPRKGSDGRQIRSTKLVHRVMLEAFVGPCPSGMVACHANDVPTDNRLENLRWDTYSANRNDSVRNGGHGYSKRTHCKNGHEFTPENTFARKGNARGCRECNRQKGRDYANSEHGRDRQREYMRKWREPRKIEKAKELLKNAGFVVEAKQ